MESNWNDQQIPFYGEIANIIKSQEEVEVLL
jgi:hypothetical protein